MKLSVVSTLYRSAEHLEEYHARLAEALSQTTEDHEIILVDDGSPDDSLAKALELQRRDNRIRIIELSRNFGHHAAIMAGLSQAQGERIFVIDSDLEEDPSLLVDFWAKMEEESEVDVVCGYQNKRSGGWFDRMSGNAFYFLLKLSTGLKLTPNQVTCRLMKKEYVLALNSYREINLFTLHSSPFFESFLGGICEITGFKQKKVPVEKAKVGKTTYSFMKKLALCLNAFTAFSGMPLMVMFFIGLLVAFLSFGISAFLLFTYFFQGQSVEQWTIILVSVWFLGGVLMIFTGLLGLYINNIYKEVKGRPRYIVRKIHQGK